MFSNVSWYHFLFIIGLCTCIYYLTVAVVYYKDILKLFTRKPSHDHAISASLSRDLKVIFRNAAKKKFQKEELVMALRRRLQSYCPLHENIRTAINNLIRMESQDQCSICLDDSELDSLWKAR